MRAARIATSPTKIYHGNFAFRIANLLEQLMKVVVECAVETSHEVKEADGETAPLARFLFFNKLA